MDEQQLMPISIEAIDCMVMHFKTFHRQAFLEEVADFGIPCSECTKVKTCNFDWLGIMQPLLSQSNVKLRLGVKEKPINARNAVLIQGRYHILDNCSDYNKDSSPQEHTCIQCDDSPCEADPK